MTSTRLPGKVLMEVVGRPLLSFQIERLRFSKRIEEIIIATTTNKEDDPIVELAQKEGLNFYRGSENDVLDRYYQVAKKHNSRHIMRVTADCPLIQSNICDRVVEAYFADNTDYIHTGLSFAEGLGCEVFNFAALEHAWKEARRTSEREHVSLYIRKRPQTFRMLTIENETDDSTYRITVDEKEDFEVVKAILKNLYRGKNEYFTIDQIKSFLDSRPEIYKLNSHIVRDEDLLKALKEDAIT